MSEALPIHRVLTPEGALVGEDVALDDPGRLGIYRSMRLVRRLDERMLNLQRQGRVGFYGTCTGQEAGGVGIAAGLRDEDWIFPGLREGGAMLHRGYPLVPYLAQVFGNAADPHLGRQMPSHQAGKSVAFVSWSSCIGNQLPQAVGAGVAMRLRGSEEIAVGCCGDGATSTGDFQVALASAVALQSRCLFVVQNNHWAISIPTAAQTRARSIADKATAHGIPRARVDGNDAPAIWSAVREAAEHVRQGKGPALLELVTYRIGAHSSSDDPSVYRDGAEVEVWKARDPLTRMRAHLERRGIWGAEAEAEFQARLDREIDAAIASAEPVAPISADRLEVGVWA